MAIFTTQYKGSIILLKNQGGYKMSEKLYEVRYYEVNEITIKKETEKQYTIEGTYWAKLSKSDLDIFISSRDAVYSHDKQKAIDIYKEYMTDLKDELLQRVNNIVTGLERLEQPPKQSKKKKGLKKIGANK